MPRNLGVWKGAIGKGSGQLCLGGSEERGVRVVSHSSGPPLKISFNDSIISREEPRGWETSSYGFEIRVKITIV